MSATELEDTDRKSADVPRRAACGFVVMAAFLALTVSSACSKKKEGHLTSINSAAAGSPEAKTKLLTVAYEQQPTWVRNFNPLNSEHSVRWPTHGGIYEPMLVFNTVTRKYVPWLATEYEWQEENKRLVFTLRSGVKWSDGKPFTAKDVAFTFDLLKQHPGVDG